MLHPRDPISVEGQEGVFLLDEEVQSIDDTGRRFIIRHRIQRALTESGAKRLAESVDGYRKGESTIHLLLAQTIPPEGAPQPVRSDAALLSSPQDDSGDSSTWGEHILAVCLKASDPAKKEAGEIFVRLARDPATPEARRAYAGWQAARLLRESDPAEAARVLSETLNDDSDLKAQQFALLAELLLRQDHAAELDKEVRRFLASNSPQLDEVLTALGETTRDLLVGEHAGDGQALIHLLEEAARGGDAAGRVDKALAEAKGQVDSLAAAHRIQQSLRDFVFKHPLPAGEPPKADRAELVRDMDAREQAGAPDACLRDSLALLTGFPPDKEFSHVLRRAYAVIRFGEISAAVRTGEPVDLEGELKGVRGVAWTKHAGEMMRVQHALQSRDGAAAGNALDAMSPDELLQPYSLWINIPALDLAGRTDEADLARETARTELGRALIRSWSEGSGSQAVLAYRLVKQLPPAADGADPIPAHWLEGCLARIQSRGMSLRLRIEDARRHQDWTEQARLAAEAISFSPTLYKSYYDQAEALYKLGRKDEARGSLEVYTQYSKNEQEYPQAMEWLREGKPVASEP